MGEEKRSTSYSLEGANRRWSEHTAEQLRAGKSPFRPARQVNIPKPGESKETKALTMISPRKQISQKAIKAALKKGYTKQHFRRIRTGSN